MHWNTGREGQCYFDQRFAKGHRTATVPVLIKVSIFLPEILFSSLDLHLFDRPSHL